MKKKKKKIQPSPLFDELVASMKSNDIKRVRQLLQENPKLVKEKSKKGNTALQIALCSALPFAAAGHSGKYGPSGITMGGRDLLRYGSA